MKLSDYVCELIAQSGVRHVFLLPGGAAMHLNDSLGKHPSLDYVVNLHEQASAIAAEAYARVSGNLGVAMVTAGPGGTNALTGVLAAWQDSTPCMFISGQAKRADLCAGSGLRQLGVQENDIVSMVRPITKYAATIIEPESIRYHMEKALHLARHGRPGPVWLDIPLDVQAAEIDTAALPGFDIEGEYAPRVTEPLISEVLSHFRKASRPVLLAGNGVRVAGAHDILQELIACLKIPVLTTRLGVDLIAGDNPLCMGMPGTLASRSANFTLQASDFLLVIGARLDLALTAYAPKNFAPNAFKVLVNIDSEELRRLAPSADITITADAKSFISELLAAAKAGEMRTYEKWLSVCNNWKEQYPFVTPAHRADSRGLSMYAFSELLADETKGDDIILPGNSGVAAELFLTAFRAKEGQRIFHNKGTGSMGFSQPAAIGACLASGGKRTICVDGDGGFMLNIQELETICRMALPIKFFVINNAGFGSIRASQANYFGRLTGADETSGLSLPNLLEVAKGFGIEGIRITASDPVREKVQHALRFPGPVVCEVVVIPDEERAPRVASRQKADGSMESGTLEDMYPYLEREEFERNYLSAVSNIG